MKYPLKRLDQKRKTRTALCADPIRLSFWWSKVHWQQQIGGPFGPSFIIEIDWKLWALIYPIVIWQVLEQYLKKSKANSLKSASNLAANVNVPTTSSISDLVDPSSSVVGSPPPPPPAVSSLPSSHHYFKSSDYTAHLIRPPSNNHFSPAYYSSPKYSTPPLPPSTESLLGSPIPDFGSSSQKFYHQYDHQNAPGPQQPPSQPHSLTSVSPTSGVRHF